MGKKLLNTTPLVRDVCLVGGGHSHALLIRQWGMQPLPGVRLTLISSDSQTPYSGMLPGLIAGHYTEDDIHIDLSKLCAWAGVRFIEQTMTGLDLQLRQATVTNHPPIGFDVLSLDTGSTPDLSVRGSELHTTPVKPVFQFYDRWQSILSKLSGSDASNVTIGVVGSGAGGFELITAMRHALPKSKAVCQWFVRNELPLSGRPEKVKKLAINAARHIGVDVLTGVDVEEVKPGQLIASDGRQFDLDVILWCTAASGPDWPSQAGLQVDSRGFVATNGHLQSISHPFVFATGDIGTQQLTPSTKAGVYAVRQAPVLFENIRRFIVNTPLKTYRPQKDFLSLMATGNKRAIASRGIVAIEADWVWRWKDHIDQTFMNRFRHLPVIAMNGRLNRLPNALLDDNNTALKPNAMRCKGCGSKVSSRVLDDVLKRLGAGTPASASLSLSPAGDAAAIAVSAGTLVQSVDQIDAIVDDPYLLGRIAVLHAMSDVLTLNATPHSVQVLLTVPAASEVLIERDLESLMRGIADALEEEECTLLGGHTNQGADLAVGIVVNAMMTEAASIQPRREVEEGDVVVLTQALGIGTLFAGLMQGVSNGRDIKIALEAMLTSNRTASNIFQQYNAGAITDVTGFGLLGHLERLLQGLGGGNGTTLELARVPFLPGAVQLAANGIRSTLWPANSVVLQRTDSMTINDIDRLALLCDPQTSGGLLAILPAEHQAECISALHEAGYLAASVIGTVTPSGKLRVA